MLTLFYNFSCKQSVSTGNQEHKPAHSQGDVLVLRCGLLTCQLLYILFCQHTSGVSS